MCPSGYSLKITDPACNRAIARRRWAWRLDDRVMAVQATTYSQIHGRTRWLATRNTYTQRRVR